MRVAMYYNNQDLRIEEMPKPAAGRGELLVKVRASGICGSDLMEWYRIKKAPLVLGHEISGEVAAAGSGVKRFKKGDRVFVSHHVPCNRCWYCLNGNHTACETLQTTNFFPGGFSEYIKVPSLNVEKGTFLLPDGVSFEAGTLIEPLGCVARAQRAAGVKSGQRILILGGGVSGLLHLLLAKVKGAAKVFVTDISSARLRMAKKLGANLAINAAEDIPKLLKKEGKGRLADIVIVSTSALSAFEQAFSSVDRGGVVVCFAPTEPEAGLLLPVNDFWRRQVKIIHSYGAAPGDLKDALGLIQREEVAVERLITHRISLEDAGLGFKLVSEGKEALKVIIIPEKTQ